MSQAVIDPYLGRTLDERYRLDHLLALGGMSRIYRGLDKRLHRVVAVKILNDQFAEESTVRKRFESEAVIAANLSHPNVVAIRDHNVSNNIVYLVMEYVRGRNLEQVIAERGRFTPRQMLSILEQVCQGLSAAHDENIIHRDIKPANVLLSDNGEVKLTDFGLARAASAHTQSATLVATLSHVSPELVSGAPADSRSDIYALGIMIYQMLTGKLPYPESNAAALMKHHLDSPMPMPSSQIPGLADDFDELVRWCTEKDPEKRPQNASLLLEEIIQIHATLDDEQLDLDAQSLGGLEDLIPQGVQNLPTTLQQRLDAMQQQRDAEREQNYQLYRAGDEVYDVENEEANDGQATTVIPTSQATEVLDLRDVQATLVQPVGDQLSALSDNGTAAYSREDLEAYTSTDSAQGSLPAQKSSPSARGQKRAAKQAERQWRKEAQIPTHSLHRPTTVGRKSIVVIAWLALVALVAGAGWFFGLGPGTILRIPSLTGLLQAQALEQLDQQGIPVRIDTVFDDDISVGRVVATTPETGAKIMRFQGVELAVSNGPELFVLPELQGATQSAARSELKDLGLNRFRSSEQYSSTIPEGSVISTAPAAGDKVSRKDTVRLLVSRGPAPVQVPELRGLSKEQAQERLSDVGLKLEVGPSVFSTVQPPDVIAQQDPLNTTVPTGSTIRVNLSKGPELYDVPSVVGMSLQDATKVIEDAGFTVASHQLLGGVWEKVTMQSPRGGQAAPGSEISLYTF